MFPQGLLTMTSAAPARLVQFQLGLVREDVWVPAGNLSYGHAKRLAAEIVQRKVTFALRTLATVGVKLGPVGQIWPTVSLYLAREARPNDYWSWPAGVRVGLGVRIRVSIHALHQLVAEMHQCVACQPAKKKTN